MSNRYRIYFFLRGVWFTVRRMECTLWILRKLPWNREAASSSGMEYNLMDGESELTGGLLMNEHDDSEFR